VSARERLDSQVNAFVAFEIMISVETLWTLIATERAVVLGVLLWHVVAVHLLHSSVSAVVVHWHAVRHAVHKCELAVRVANVGKHRSKRRVGERRAMLWVICRCL
jgi:hypothetical protein